MRTAATLARVAVAVVVSAALLLVLAAMFGSPTGRAWGAALTATVDSGDGGPADIVRGGLRWIAPPVVLLAVLWWLVHAFVAGRRRAAVVALVLGLGSFATTQAIKLWFLPFPRFGADTGRELSGHAAMAASAVLVIVICAPPARRRLVAVLAGAAAWCLSLGAAAARWHDAGEVVIALAIAIGWAICGWAFLGSEGASHDDGAFRFRWRPATLLVALPAVAAWGLVALGQAASVHAPAQTVLATALAVLAATAALTLVALAVADRLDVPTPQRLEVLIE